VSREDQWAVMNLQISRHILEDCQSKGIVDGFERWLKPQTSEFSLSLYRRFSVLSSNNERVRFRIQYPEIEIPLTHLRNAAINMDLFNSSSSELSYQLRVLNVKLNATHPLADTYKWAYIKNYIGKVLALRQENRRMQHLQDAIQHWMTTLEILQPNLISEGLLWAEIQVNLAMAFIDSRMPGNRLDNFTMAQSCINKALKIYSRKFTPIKWGTIQLRIAQIYIEHPQQEFLKAVHHMKAALNILSQYSENPLVKAKIEADLGMLYLVSEIGNKDENIDAAIEYLQKSLDVFIRYEDKESQRLVYKNIGYDFSETGLS
jgi:tetratricopeptide (TPR) repeat protein